MSTSRAFLLASVVAFCASPALAGTLATDSRAYIDPSLHQWSGVSAVYQGKDSNGGNSGLAGYIEWAVYAPGQFPFDPTGTTGFAGYVPVPGDYTYTYQGFQTVPLNPVDPPNEPLAPLSQINILVGPPIDQTGWFQGDGVFDTTGNGGGIPFSGFDGTQVIFAFGGVAAGQATAGLAFSSPNPPVLSQATTIDDGTRASVMPVPSDKPVNIPEPATLTLALFGFAGFAFQWLRRRGRKTEV